MIAQECGRLDIVNPLTDPAWDSRVSSFDDGSFFHGTAWARVLQQTYGYTPLYFRSDGGDGPTLLHPMMEVSSWLSGRRGISLPFTDECRTLTRNALFLRPLFRSILQLAGNQKWKYQELRGGTIDLGNATPSISFYGHSLQLEADTLKVFARFTGAVRTAVRKAEQGGLVAEIASTQEAVSSFYRLLCKTRSRHGMPPQPPLFFENIGREIIQKGLGCVVLARWKDIPVAGAVFFHHAKQVIYKFAASDDAYKHLQGNNFVLWKAIESYAKKGFAIVDFGRTSLSNSGLRRFKLAWNTQERAIDYVRFENKANTFCLSPDRADASWFTRIYKLLPPSFGPWVGATIYKHLA